MNPTFGAKMLRHLKSSSYNLNLYEPQLSSQFTSTRVGYRSSFHILQPLQSFKITLIPVIIIQIKSLFIPGMGRSGALKCEHPSLSCLNKITYIYINY
ncbi:hypothetical protein VNO77_35444 [Canavalia gladiata]|uniref:Uncharacterized protein n=1 Tax=Canavalia gladiata TaxID=3824 RepID=A0AAN9KFC6_CANGL